MAVTAILTIILLIFDCGVASADMINPPITLMLSIPVSLFLFLGLMLYLAIKFIISLRANPYTTFNTRNETSPETPEEIEACAENRKPEKSILEILWKYCTTLFYILIALIIFSIIESDCNNRMRARRPHSLFNINDASKIGN